MSDGADNQGAPNVRRKAVQDLEVVAARRRDAEQRVLELRAEQAELEAFIRRLDRYDPPSAANDPGEASSAQAKIPSDARNLLLHGLTIDHLKTAPFTPSSKARALTAVMAARKAELAARAAPSAVQMAVDEALAASERTTSSSADVAAALSLSPAYLASTSVSAAANNEVDAVVRATLAYYEGHAANETRALVRHRHRPLPSPESRRGRIGTEVAQIMDLLGPATTKFLVDMLRAHPELYSFLGTRPEATLSSYLSRDPRFLYDQENRVWTRSNPQSEGVDQDDAVAEGASDERSVS